MCEGCHFSHDKEGFVDHLPFFAYSAYWYPPKSVIIICKLSASVRDFVRRQEDFRNRKKDYLEVDSPSVSFLDADLTTPAIMGSKPIFKLTEATPIQQKALALLNVSLRH